MPTLPARPCSVPGCPNVALRGGLCETHKTKRQHEYNAQRGSAAAQGYDARWRKIRGRYLKHHEVCETPGCGQRATDVDHIKALKDGGTDEWSNLQALCHEHHSQKTAREDGRWG